MFSNLQPRQDWMQLLDVPNHPGNIRVSGFLLLWLISIVKYYFKETGFSRDLLSLWKWYQFDILCSFT